MVISSTNLVVLILLLLIVHIGDHHEHLALSISNIFLAFSLQCHLLSIISVCSSLAALEEKKKQTSITFGISRKRNSLRYHDDSARYGCITDEERRLTKNVEQLSVGKDEGEDAGRDAFSLKSKVCGQMVTQLS